MSDNYIRDLEFYIVVIKGTVSSRSEQTFNRAWNRCPGFKMNTVTGNYWLVYAATTVI